MHLEEDVLCRSLLSHLRLCLTEPGVHVFPAWPAVNKLHGSPAPTSPSLELYAVVRYSHVADLSSGPRGRLEAHVASTFLTEPATVAGCRMGSLTLTHSPESGTVVADSRAVGTEAAGDSRTF